ncbi:hypothetical protein GUJ93_ZPchr0002g24771 [Zizania palustris]|uniref:Uncharacterized protein n=1 Tax=Zizania palustris TaxID=103762 RepID=A0A8J5RQV9_ZIZPA|nr:hypothetical protein GUJ93_ZPchr0002g24771 [Zizania palustris]
MLCHGFRRVHDEHRRSACEQGCCPAGGAEEKGKSYRQGKAKPFFQLVLLLGFPQLELDDDGHAIQSVVCRAVSLSLVVFAAAIAHSSPFTPLLLGSGGGASNPKDFLFVG